MNPNERTSTNPDGVEGLQAMSNDILRELSACKASDPYRTKTWIPHMRGKWMTVNVPTDLWERIQAAAATGGMASEKDRRVSDFIAGAAWHMASPDESLDALQEAAEWWATEHAAAGVGAVAMLRIELEYDDGEGPCEIICRGTEMHMRMLDARLKFLHRLEQQSCVAEVVEKIAKEWDGCMAPMFDPAGNPTDPLDIGATIRDAHGVAVPLKGER